MNQWYYATNGAQQGPASYEQLAQWAQAGSINAQTMVWRDGMAQWEIAGNVAELAPIFASTVGAGDGSDTAYGVAPGVPQQPNYAYTASPYPTQGYGAGYPAQGYRAPPGQAAYGQFGTLNYGQASYAPRGLVYAGFWWRFLAVFIDGIIVGIFNGIVGAILGAIAGEEGEFIGNLLGLIVAWLYDALQESSVTQATLGKRLCGIVVTDIQGNRLSFGRATGRHFAKYISGCILGFGYFMQVWTQYRQALHDIMAGTLVWKKPQ
jgi:uncharacterized RDD family membrane protein YckC